MAAYLAQRIIDGAYTYEYVISKRPDLEEGIDAYLEAHGWTQPPTEGGE